MYKYRFHFLYFLYFTAAVFIFHIYSYRLNPDAASYMDIAIGYANGRFDLAVNNYWNPLYSWLMVPFLILRLQPVFTAHLVSVLAGGGALYIVYRVAQKLIKNEILSYLISLMTIPYLLYYGIGLVTPDIVFLLCFMIYFHLISDDSFLRSSQNAVLIGLSGALMYFSKTYGFYFFILHFSVVFFIHSLKTKRYVWKNNRMYLVSMGVFLLVSGLWVVTMFTKYRSFTIGASSTYNQAIRGPSVKTFPPIPEGFYLPQIGETSLWDNPTRTQYPSWSMFSSISNFVYQSKIILLNVVDLIRYLKEFSLFLIPFGFVWLLSIIQKKEWDKKETLVSLSIILLYPLGYLTIAVEPRTFLPVYVVLLLLVFPFMVMSARQLFQLRGWILGVFVGIVFLSFIQKPIRLLIGDYRVYRQDENLFQLFRETYGIHSTTIASDSNWGVMIPMAFLTDSRYAGIPKQNENFNDIAGYLDKNKIEYYVVWNIEKSKDSFGENYLRISNKNTSPQIFKRKGY